MNIKRAGEKRLARKLNQLKHDDPDNRLIFYIKCELKKRTLKEKIGRKNIYYV